MTKPTKTQNQINAELHERSGVKIIPHVCLDVVPLHAEAVLIH